MCKICDNPILDFVYENFNCNEIFPALVNVYRYLKAVNKTKTVNVFPITADSFPMTKDGKKVCSRCLKLKLATNEYFPKRKSSPDGLDSWCKKCKRKWDKLYHLWKTYGITPKQYYAMLEQQNYSCGSCGDPINKETAEVHHKHGTKIVYGLLCDRCNRTISLAKDDWRLLLNATMYQAEKDGIDLRKYLKCKFQEEN